MAVRAQWWVPVVLALASSRSVVAFSQRSTAATRTKATVITATAPEPSEFLDILTSTRATTLKEEAMQAAFRGPDVTVDARN